MVTQTKEVFGNTTIDDFNVLNTSDLLPILVNATQEQQEIIEKQQDEIESLKQQVEKINDLEEQLKALKALIQK